MSGAPSGGLVVNADDLGVSHGATLGILRAHREGCVTSASLAVTTPGYHHAVESCVRACPELGIGLHFTLTSGSPAAPHREVPLLVDRRGFLRWRFLPLLRAVRGPAGAALRAQIAIELEAQLARLRGDGIQPDHLDGERHVHLIPDIFSLVADAAERHGIGWVRCGADLGGRLLAAGHLPALLLNGGFAKSWLLGRLSRQNRARLRGGLRSPDYVASYLYTGETPRMAARLAERLPGGVVELMVHPGQPEQSGGLELGNRELERYLVAAGRRRELEACLAARERFRGSTLTNYTRLSRAAVAA